MKHKSLISEIQRAAARLQRGRVVRNEALVVAHVVGASESALNRRLHSVAIALLIEDIGGDFVVQKAHNVFDRVRLGGHDARHGEQLGHDVHPMLHDFVAIRRHGDDVRFGVESLARQVDWFVRMRVHAFQYNAIS